MNILKAKLVQDIEKEINKLTLVIKKLETKSRKFSLIRLVCFLSGLILFISLFVLKFKISAVFIGLSFTSLFLILIVIHNKIDLSLKKFKAYILIKEEFLARVKLNWEKIPKIREEYLSQISPLEIDLNILGDNSLLQLINFSVSVNGLQKLRKWFSNSDKEITSIVGRQKIIKELKKLPRFRNRFLLTSRLAFKSGINKIEISSWLNEEKEKKGLKIYTLLLGFLSLLNISLITVWTLGITENFYYQPLLVYMFLYMAGNKFSRNIQTTSEFLYDEVRKFSSVFRFIETYNYKKNENLKKFLEPIINSKVSPSKSLNSLKLTVEILNFRKNPYVWLFIIAVCPIDYILAIKIEKFRATIKNQFPLWLKTWTTLEAYCSLANFSFLNPEYIFPEIGNSHALFTAEGIGHPLIKGEYKIANSFEISSSKSTNIITGSNMSGKSTFLRTVGCNILLAYSGSVVDAKQLSLKIFDLYSCIKVSDSVVDGISYFYSEVKRLKGILESIETSDRESLVLIDEIYKGTNNVERIVGSRALLKFLANKKVYNIVSTHDLELVRISEEIDYVKNYHFKESIVEKVMSFDYKLTEGPCPTTNALKIMEIEGLPT
ncbi:MAG: hypothetical protein JEY94_11930 [Melioribacteraceae bacterium]|nr:hypothetical protein [Melioribacteraceae bacterium]